MGEYPFHVNYNSTGEILLNTFNIVLEYSFNFEEVFAKRVDEIPLVG